MTTTKATATLALCMVGLACGGDDRPPPSADGGPIILFDGGPRRDGGGGARDGGPSTSCPPMTVPAPTGPECDAATLTCLMGCGMNATCIENCIAADSSAGDCELCLLGEVLSCATSMGCDDEWGNFVCCGQMNCPMGSPSTCIQTSCGSQLTAMQSCLGGLRCGNTMLCFRTASGG